MILKHCTLRVNKINQLMNFHDIAFSQCRNWYIFFHITNVWNRWLWWYIYSKIKINYWKESKKHMHCLHLAQWFQKSSATDASKYIYTLERLIKLMKDGYLQLIGKGELCDNNKRNNTFPALFLNTSKLFFYFNIHCVFADLGLQCTSLPPCRCILKQI